MFKSVCDTGMQIIVELMGLRPVRILFEKIPIFGSQ